MDKKAYLIELGLSEQEASIYLALLKIGGSIASKIAKEAGMQRTAVYPILKTLAHKNCILVYFRKNKKFYYAQKPQKLLSVFENKIKGFESIIPFLESAEKKKETIFGLQFVETKEELQQFYLNVLEDYKNKSYCIVGNVNAWEEGQSEFLHQYRLDRAKAKIKTKALLTHSSRRLNPTDNKKYLREFKYLPEKYEFNCTMDIFDDKISVVSPNLSSMAVIISIPEMVGIFKAMFEIIWDTIGDEKAIS
ncbi:MAG TPA: helix-turn-helix domain-containing protein [Candidatus Moranbacteria bacterium]|nr:helix-turn-helix domain-containing protein [Candidatus Moranbacteria bacterium]